MYHPCAEQAADASGSQNASWNMWMADAACICAAETQGTALFETHSNIYKEMPHSKVIKSSQSVTYI